MLLGSFRRPQEDWFVSQMVDERDRKHIMCSFREASFQCIHRKSGKENDAEIGEEFDGIENETALQFWQSAEMLLDTSKGTPPMTFARMQLPNTASS